MQRIADALIADEEVAPDAANQQIQDLLLVGTSMGGARPKAVVEDGNPGRQRQREIKCLKFSAGV